MDNGLLKEQIHHIVRKRNYAPRLEQHEVIIRYMNFSPNDYVLDIGCGFGEFLENIKGSVRISVGLDIDMACLRECNRYIPESEFLKSEATCLPFVDDSFDIVIAIGVIEHVNNPVSLLREVRRICRGSAVFMTPNLGRPSRLIMAAKGKIHRERSGHKQGWDYHLFNQVLEHNGWTVDRIETRFVDFPFYNIFPQNFSRWMSYKVLKKLFPKIGSELYAFCLTNK